MDGLALLKRPLHISLTFDFRLMIEGAVSVVSGRVVLWWSSLCPVSGRLLGVAQSRRSVRSELLYERSMLLVMWVSLDSLLGVVVLLMSLRCFILCLFADLLSKCTR